MVVNVQRRRMSMVWFHLTRNMEFVDSFLISHHLGYRWINKDGMIREIQHNLPLAMGVCLNSGSGKNDCVSCWGTHES